MRTFGVEEELLLVDEATGSAVPAAQQVLAAAALGRSALTTEFQQEMVEVVTRPHTDVLELAAQVRTGRADADTAARHAGVRAAALATPPLPGLPHGTPTPRYRAIVSRFGALARRTLACGLHVHVGVESPDEGVGVLDRIRVWLPVLVALSANSPFADGEDTGYASWRTMVWQRWPNAGPNPVFGDVEAYRRFEQQQLDSGVVLDPAMLYFEARLSHSYPTVEVRVADVPLDATATAMIAALVRALVDTAAEEWRDGVPAPPVPEAMLRLAAWQAALRGVHGPLADPATGRPAPAEAVVAALVDHVRSALERSGDERLVRACVGAVLEQGTGADAQRAAVQGDVAAAVRAAIDRTHRPVLLPADPPRDRPAWL